MNAVTRRVARLADAIERQNASLRRGQFADLRDATEATRRLTASIEEGFADGQRLLPHEASPVVRRLRHLLGENARLIAAARSGVAAGRRLGAVGYRADGGPVDEESSALTPRSPKQL